MKDRDKVHTIPEEYLKDIANSTSRRHASKIAGWLNGSHGATTENRRAIQAAISSWKKTKLTKVNNRGSNENHI